MPPSRCELSEAQWERIRDFLPGREKHVGRTAADNRVFVNGEPVDLRITAGQVNDCTQAGELLGQRQAEAVIADKGYDSDSILAHVEAMNAEPVIPSPGGAERCSR